MEYKDIYDCGNKLNKLAFNRTFSLATGSKEDYYNRFVRRTDYLELNNVENDFIGDKFVRSFESYSNPQNQKFSMSFNLKEDLNRAIKLPKVYKSSNKNLEQIFFERSSKREFKNTIWSLQDVSNLFSGIRVFSNKHRSYASGGGLYPINLYFFAQKIRGLKKMAVYRYQPVTHTVLEIGEIHQNNLSAYAHIENFVNLENISMMMFLVNNRNENEFKYGNRGTIFSLVEAGEMIQNIALCAAEYNYKMCQLGGYNIEKSNVELKINGVNTFIAACAVVGS